MNQLVLELGALAVLVLGAVEAVGRAQKKLGKDLLALIFGPATAVCAYGLGWLSIPPDGWAAWGMAVLAGLACTILSALGNDYLVKAVQGAVRRNGGTP